jgi:hypothetical protein
MSYDASVWERNFLSRQKLKHSTQKKKKRYSTLETWVPLEVTRLYFFRFQGRQLPTSFTHKQSICQPSSCMCVRTQKVTPIVHRWSSRRGVHSANCFSGVKNPLCFCLPLACFHRAVVHLPVAISANRTLIHIENARCFCLLLSCFHRAVVCQLTSTSNLSNLCGHVFSNRLTLQDCWTFGDLRIVKSEACLARSYCVQPCACVCVRERTQSSVSAAHQGAADILF